MNRIILTGALMVLAFNVNAQSAAIAGAGAQAGALAGSTSGAAAGIDVTIEAAKQLEKQTLNYDGTYTIRNVPNVIPPNIFPTAPCMGASSLGGAVAGFGIGGGTSWIAENCEHRENARLLHAMNDVPNAKIAMCMQSTMTEHPMCKAMAPKPAPLPAKVSNVDPKDPRVVTGSERARDNMVMTGAGGSFKSYEDSALTKAAMEPTAERQQLARCDYAKRIGDNILADRFGCAGK